MSHFMIRSSTIQLLRFHFSFFLMPIYWFALSQVNEINIRNALLIFVILHLLVYPASNGYNSYMDRDTESIGGLANPQQPTRQLFYASVLLDMIALIASAFISTLFLAGIFIYIAASRAYSYRGIRLKQYPVIGYLTVITCQGGLVFFLVMEGASVGNNIHVPLIGMIAASLLIGGFYPLTQIYQHKQDKADGVTTLSYLLGYRSTFIFTALIYFLAMTSLAVYMAQNLELGYFFSMQLFFIPVLVYFGWWFLKVYRDTSMANFTNTMRMNLLASLCSNAGFIFLFLIRHH